MNKRKKVLKPKFNTIFNPDSPVEYYAGIEKVTQEHYNKVTNQLEEFDGKPDRGVVYSEGKSASVARGEMSGSAV